MFALGKALVACLNILFSCLLVVALALCAVCSGCNFFMVWFQVGSGHRQILSKMLVGSRADSLGKKLVLL